MIESHARRWLAGDRAVRLLDPQMETSHGGPSSDYTMAVSLLEAVCDSDELVEAELDRHCQAVDDYFARDDVRQQLASFASLLISERQLDAASIAGVLSDGDCGARNFDTGERCTGPWHWAGDHAVLRGLSPIGPIWGCWDGFGAPDRTPKSKRTKRHRNVIRILEPHIYPPPPIYRGIKLADLPVFGRSASPTRQQAKALQRKLTAGARNGDALLLAGSGDCSASDRATHERRCGPLINDNEDGLWCAFCGFEQRSNRAKRQRWVYYLSISTYDGDSEVEPVPEHPAFMFCEAQLAAKYLLFLRQSSPEDFSGGIKRVPLVGDLESIKPTTT